MREVCHAIAGQYLRGHATLLHLLCLELHHIQFLGHLGENMQVKVHIGCGKVFHGGKSLTVLAAGINLLNKLFWDYLSCLVVACILLQYLGFESPVLVDL